MISITFGQSLVGQALGESEITGRVDETTKTMVFKATVVLPRFNQDVKPIVKDKCGKCHGPAVTFNLQDSSVLVSRGKETLRRIQLPKTDGAHMPAEGELTARQLNILKSWLTAKYVPLSDVVIAPLTLKLGETRFPELTWSPVNASNQYYRLLPVAVSVAESPDSVRLTGKSIGSTAVLLITREGDKTKPFTVTVVAWPVDSFIGIDTSVQAGDSVLPRVEVFPEEATNKSYTLASINPAIATVLPSGKVKGATIGTAQIQITSTQNPLIKDTLLVTVGPVPVTSITVANYPMVVGQTLAPPISFIPASATDKSYALTLGTAGIVSVVNPPPASTPSLQALATGSVLVTATTTNGKTASFTVTVGNVLATSISLIAPNSISVGSRIKTTGLFLPSNTTRQTYTLASTASGFIQAKQDSIIALALGSSTITATAIDGPTNSKVITVVMPYFSGTVKGVVTKKCLTCHGPTIDEQVPNLGDSAIAFTHRLKVLDRITRSSLTAGFMPGTGVALSADTLKILTDWFKW